MNQHYYIIYTSIIWASDREKLDKFRQNLALLLQLCSVNYPRFHTSVYYPHFCTHQKAPLFSWIRGGILPSSFLMEASQLQITLLIPLDNWPNSKVQLKTL